MKITARLRDRRVRARNRRAVDAAINHAASPAMRDELIIMAQQQHYINR